MIKQYLYNRTINLRNNQDLHSEQLYSLYYKQEEQEAITSCVVQLETLLSTIFKDISPAELLLFKEVPDKNKILLNKVNNYHTNQPELSCTTIDWDAFNATLDSKSFVESILVRLQHLIASLNDAKLRYDYECYQTALKEFQYNKKQLVTCQAGYDIKVKDLGPFFKQSLKRKNDQ